MPAAIVQYCLEAPSCTIAGVSRVCSRWCEQFCLWSVQQMHQSSRRPRHPRLLPPCPVKLAHVQPWSPVHSLCLSAGGGLLSLRLRLRTGVTGPMWGRHRLVTCSQWCEPLMTLSVATVKVFFLCNFSVLVLLCPHTKCGTNGQMSGVCRSQGVKACVDTIHRRP